MNLYKVKGELGQNVGGNHVLPTDLRSFYIQSLNTNNCVHCGYPAKSGHKPVVLVCIKVSDKLLQLQYLVRMPILEGTPNHDCQVFTIREVTFLHP